MLLNFDVSSIFFKVKFLICALFLKHFRPLVEAGHVFIAQPPLFRIDQDKDVYYALDEDEKEKVVKDLKSKNKQKKIEIQRFKGLGEMNPSQLRETTMEIEGRRLLKLTLEKGNTSISLMDMLLSKKRASDRKNWLETKGDLASLNE